MHGCVHQPSFGRGGTQEEPKQVLRATSLRRHLVPSKRKLIILAQKFARGGEEASCPQNEIPRYCTVRFPAMPQASSRDLAQ